MNYARSLASSVSKGWYSINPATLSGAIDVIVVEQDDGSLACSPFHVRFGKFQLLRPSDKKVTFRVNDAQQDYAMKLGEGGEAFFVFETSADIPEEMQTSPLASPVASPEQKPVDGLTSSDLAELESLTLDGSDGGRRSRASLSVPPGAPRPSLGLGRPNSGDWSGVQISRSQTEGVLPTSANTGLIRSLDGHQNNPLDKISKEEATAWNKHVPRSASPPPVSSEEAMKRAISLSKKLFVSNIPNEVNDNGDLKLDMTGYKSSEEEALRAEVVARRILTDELEGSYDIGALIGTDEEGNLWIYSSEEAKAAANKKFNMLDGPTLQSADAVSDPGYHSDDAQSDTTTRYASHLRRDSDSGVGLSMPASPDAASGETRNYAKTLRLTSDQLKALELKPGSNSMSFTVNRSTCSANMFYWKHSTPIVISDIDGTITKSDALGHVLNMIGRDWTHQGVAKLYTDIINNGYNIFYLTSRSVGQADTTRAYLNGVIQDGYRLPKGPVIMSPDRTIAALRREIYLRKPEVFKMQCLKDIKDLFGKPTGQTPFYAGFGNRFTDALSYRSVMIPSTRIFTINSNAEVSLDVLSLNSYKTGYASMREIVDHFFPPVGLLVPAGGEEFTDFNYWRERPIDLADFTDSEDEEDAADAGSLRSEDEGSQIGEDLEDSYISRDSLDGEAGMEDSILESVEGDYYEDGDDRDDSDEEYDEEDEYDDEDTDELAATMDGLSAQTTRLQVEEHDNTPTPQGSPTKAALSSSTPTSPSSPSTSAS